MNNNNKKKQVQEVRGSGGGWGTFREREIFQRECCGHLTLKS